MDLATILEGDEPTSSIYVRNKRRAAERVDMLSRGCTLTADVAQIELKSLIARLNQDDDIDGINFQLPLPQRLDSKGSVQAVTTAKDADGLRPHNLGLLVLDQPDPRPATSCGCSTTTTLRQRADKSWLWAGPFSLAIRSQRCRQRRAGAHSGG